MRIIEETLVNFCVLAMDNSCKLLDFMVIIHSNMFKLELENVILNWIQVDPALMAVPKLNTYRSSNTLILIFTLLILALILALLILSVILLKTEITYHSYKTVTKLPTFSCPNTQL